MALFEVGVKACRPLRRQLYSSFPRQRNIHQSRNASAAPVSSAISDISELEALSSLTSTTSAIESASFNPVAQATSRKRQLPPSRYAFRPPQYYRGPLHPVQPPRAADPASRVFVPGPFSHPRLQQTYDDVVAADMLTLTYVHYPPGYVAPTRGPRLRSWDDSSPYHKGRPLRAPRGGKGLPLLDNPITFRNVPKPTGVTVHTFVPEAFEGNAALHVATMAIQAITGVRCKPHDAKKSVVAWGAKKGTFCALTADLGGEDMYHFLSKLVDVVMPRIRDWKGIKGSSGDDNGNISVGFNSDVVALFPEIEVNYDSYPPNLIPGIDVYIKTSATNDRDARLLLTAMGFPFHGEFVK